VVAFLGEDFSGGLGDFGFLRLLCIRVLLWALFGHGNDWGFDLKLLLFGDDKYIN